MEWRPCADHGRKHDTGEEAMNTDPGNGPATGKNYDYDPRRSEVACLVTPWEKSSI